MSRWYRAYEGTITDAKLAEAAMVAEVSRSVSIAGWHALLESAATVNNCGSYETTARRIAIVLGEPVERIEALFAAYDEIGLTQSGAIRTWKKRQHESDSSTDRTRRWRERQKTANGDDGDENETSQNAPYTEAETETEDKVSNETYVAEPNSENEEGLELTPEHLQEAWNDGPVKNGAIQCRKLKGSRRRRTVTFLRKWKVDEITEAIAAAAKSAFLCGHTKEGFRADISFLFSEEHMNRLLEGFYGR